MTSPPVESNATGAQSPLVSAVVDLSSQLEGPSLACLRGMICNVAQSLSPTGEFPTDPQRRAHFVRAIKMLAPMQQHPRMTETGVCYRGRPDFMTDELLHALQTEATEVVRPRAMVQRGHMLGVGAPLADEMAKGPALRGLVEDGAGPVEATGVSSFLFYEEEGSGLAAHVDTDVFALNVNLMLEHSSTGDKRSHLFVFNSDGETRTEIRHEPGEIVITFGDSIVHGRAPLAAGERVTLLTIGFQPAHW